MPQTTQMMQDRVVAFQLPAVLPERVPGGLGRASASLIGSLLSASLPHSCVCEPGPHVACKPGPLSLQMFPLIWSPFLDLK